MPTPRHRAAPPIRLPQQLRLPPARHWTLPNGLAVVAIDGAKTPILRLELIFSAGRPYEQQRLVARATNELISEGSRKRSAAELEAFFEYYGTTLSTPNVFDTGHLVLYTIHSHLAAVLPVLTEVLCEPTFASSEFRTFVKRSKQDLREDLTDPDTIAYRHFTEYLFGPNHPYGYNGTAKDYDQLQREDVIAHHQRAYCASNGTLVVAGQLNTQVEAMIERYLGQIPAGPALLPQPWEAQTAAPRLLQLQRPKAQQTLIRQGRQLFHRSHADYPGLTVLNTIFGGYFGSRLMRNIREEKGYTYGIDSSLEFMRFGGYLTVSADVANENLTQVRQEIKREIEKLQTDLVTASELDLVRAYLLGGLLNDLDGPLNIGERYQMMVVEGVTTEHFTHLVDTITHISAATVRELAQEYLGSTQDWEVIVGGAKMLPGAEKIH